MKVWIVEDVQAHFENQRDYLANLKIPSLDRQSIVQFRRPNLFWQAATQRVTPDVPQLANCDLLIFDIDFRAEGYNDAANGRTCIHNLWQTYAGHGLFPRGCCVPLMISAAELHQELHRELADHNAEGPFYDCWAMRQKFVDPGQDQNGFYNALQELAQKVTCKRSNFLKRSARISFFEDMQSQLNQLR